MHKAIFLDRDGTVSEEVGYMYDAGLYKLFPWTGDAIRRINESGFKAVLITNQSGVGRGYFPESTVHQVHDILKTELARYAAHLDAIYYCPHEPAADCECRKPKPGMLRQASRELDLDLANSYMIGDKYIDIETGHAAGAKTILLRTGYGTEQIAEHYASSPVQPDLIADDLLQAVEAILAGRIA